MSVVASLGHLTRDVVSGASPRPGGAVFYSARALAHIGADAHVAASCARDDRGDLLPPLEAFGLHVIWFESATTTRYSFWYDGDRRIMRQDAVGEPWSPERAIAGVGDAKWIHVGALVRSDFPPAALAALADGGRKLLVDAHGLVRTPALGPLRMDSEIGDTLGHVSILKLNDEEAEMLVGDATPQALQGLGVPEVLLTLGPKGSVVITPDSFESVAAVEAGVPLDPTGAGDMLSAAYLFARSAGAEPVEAARTATAVAGELLADR